MTLDQAVSNAVGVLSALPFAPSPEGMGKLWIIVCRRNAVTPEELAEATGVLMETCDRCPAPVQMLDAVKAIRARKEREMFARGVTGEDSNRLRILSHAHMFENGTYTGDVPALGERARQLPPGNLGSKRNRIKELPDRTLPDGTIEVDESELARKRQAIEDAR